ncbi:MAG: PIN domain-containing protein [Chloroflexi bacterium]|nr:PIN domain-containing protein [Chloroflexota bacterium]
MPSKHLVDTSFLYTLFNSQDKNHTRSLSFIKAASKVGDRFLFPEIILGEVTFLFRRKGRIPAVSGFLGAFLAMQPALVSLEYTDIERAREILDAYPEAELDFVDCCIMALSERLNITKICTFDRRDFSMVAPAHAQHFELLPN